MSTFENVTVQKKANVYFDGKCVSHTIIFSDGTRKTLGLIFPTEGASLNFNTGAAELMEINAGVCRVRLAGEQTFTTYQAGQSFNVPAQSSFDIEVVELLDYICHFLG